MVRQSFASCTRQWIQKLPSIDSEWSTLLQVLGSHSLPVNAVNFSPDGKMLASASTTTVSVWEAASGALLQTIQTHALSFRCCRFLSDSKSLLLVSNNLTATVWNSVTGELLLEFKPCDIVSRLKTLERLPVSCFPPDTVNSECCWHSWSLLDAFYSVDLLNAKLFVSVIKKKIGLSRCESQTEMYKLMGSVWVQVEALVWSRNGEMLAFALETNVKLHDKSGAEICRLRGLWDRIDAMFFLLDNELLVLASGNNFNLWEVRTGNLIGIFHRYDVYGPITAVSSDGKLQADVSDSKIVRLSSIGPGEALRSLEGHSDRISAIEFSPDSKILASASYDGTVRLWDTSIKPALPSLDAHWDHVTALSFSPDGKFLASAAKDNIGKLWNVEKRELYRNFAIRSGHVHVIAFSPDSQLLAMGMRDFKITLRRPAEGAVVKILEGHSMPITAMAFSADSTMLASTSERGEVKLWDAVMGKELTNSGWIDAVTISPDGKTFCMRRETSAAQAFPQPFISFKKHWVLRHNEPLLWLPPDHRPCVSAIHGYKVGLGYKSGRVTIIDLSP